MLFTESVDPDFIGVVLGLFDQSCEASSQVSEAGYAFSKLMDGSCGGAVLHVGRNSGLLS